MKSLLVGLLSFFALSASAYQAPHGIRSPKGLLMGDAFTAVGTDEFTLFYNPASLGRHSHDITFYPFNPQVTGTNVLGDMEKYEDFPDTPNGIAELLMNEPLHAGVSITPGFKLFNFGFNFIASESVDLLVRNKISPVMDVDYRSDRGFVIGGAIPLGTSRLGGAKSNSGMLTSLGFGVKYLKRKGLYDTLSLTGTDILDNIGTDADAEDIIKRIGIVEGDAWGFDAGLEHVVRKGAHQFSVGIAALDITSTEFEVKKNDDGKTVAANRDQVNLGAAWLMRTALFKGSFSMDVRNLTQEQEFLERFRLGVEAGTPIISVLGGWNAGYLSYGLALDLGMLKVTAGFYGVEAGGKYNQLESERFVIYLSLFDFSFDA